MESQADSLFCTSGSQTTRKASNPVTLTDYSIVSLWHTIGYSQGLSTDADVARFLLSFYQSKNGNDSQSVCGQCVRCKTPLVPYCIKCQRPSLPASCDQNTAAVPQTSHSGQVPVHSPSSQASLSQSSTAAQCSTLSSASFRPKRELPHRVDDGGDSDNDCEDGLDVHFPPSSDEDNSASCHRDTVTSDGPLTGETGTNSSLQNTDFFSVSVKEFLTGKFLIPTKVIDDRQFYSHYMCGKCKLVFTSRSVFDYHSQSCTQNVRDELPPQASETLQRMQKKWRKSCRHCSLMFASEEGQKEHFRLSGHVDDGQHTCQNCGLTFPDALRLEVNAAFKPGRKRTCDKCGMTFTFKCQLKPHLISHLGNEETFQCKHCDEKFVSQKERERHAKFFHKFRCRRCTGAFPTAEELKEHKTNHVEKPRCLCTVCGKSFKNKTGLKKHSSLHSEERAFPCPQCTYAAKDKHQLARHMGVHGERNYVCETCGEKFVTIYRLKLHRLTHSSQRFKCKHCSKTCLTAARLRIHSMHHTGQKPFVCSVCGRGFIKKDYLMLHTRCHQDKRPYECEFCPATFKRGDYLTKHRRIHTGERPYKCKDCMGCFIDATVLKNHQRKQHPWRIAGAPGTSLETAFDSDDSLQSFSAMN